MTEWIDLSTPVIQPPDPEMMLNSMRSIGYTFDTAVADVIDNSIAAEATEIKLCSSVTFVGQKPFLVIIDNGTGMTHDELLQAMRHACKSPNGVREKSDLGRFGLGLKTASLSQCRQLTVISKKNGQMSGACWDLNVVRESGQWLLLDIQPEGFKDVPYIHLLDEYESGTLVCWRDFDSLSDDPRQQQDLLVGERLPHLIQHLSLVFHRFISGTHGAPLISFNVGPSKLIAKDPFLMHPPAKAPASNPGEEKLFTIGENQVRVCPYTLPVQDRIRDLDVLGIGGTLYDTQGFYIYRNHRLISWGSWLGLWKRENSTRLSRVMVEIDNDADFEWGLDVKKSKATPPPELRQKLRQLRWTIVNRSHERETGKPVRDVDDQSKHEALYERLWLEDSSGEGRTTQFALRINPESQILQDLKSRLDEQSLKIVETYLGLLELGIPYEWMRQRFNAEATVQIEDSPKKQSTKAFLKAWIESKAETKEDQLQAYLDLKAQNVDFANDISLTRKVIDELIGELQ